MAHKNSWHVTYMEYRNSSGFSLSRVQKEGHNYPFYYAMQATTSAHEQDEYVLSGQAKIALSLVLRSPPQLSPSTTHQIVCLASPPHSPVVHRRSTTLQTNRGRPPSPIVFPLRLLFLGLLSGSSFVWIHSYSLYIYRKKPREYGGGSWILKI
jgi:hypothetical protein